MKKMPNHIFEACQVAGGIVLLVVAGLVVQWWLLTGMALFFLGMVLLCIATIEEEVADKEMPSTRP